MQHLKKRQNSYLALSLFAFVLFLLQFSDILPILGGSYPVLLLPLVLVFGAYFGAFPGAVAGAVIGTVMDIYTGGSPSFHMVVFCVFGCIAGILITYYLNHNWQAMAMITVFFCLLYYFLRWVCFYSIPGSFVSYFLAIGLPSALYTAILSIPVYLLAAWILRMVEKMERR